MFCPKCEAEYIEGITECADCNIPLVEQLPGSGEDEITGASAAEDLFPIMTFLDREEAVIARGFLESNGVDAILSTDETILIRQGASSSKGIRLLIRPEDKQDALEIFRLAGIHPEDQPYRYEKELPEVPVDSPWKSIAAKIFWLIVLAAIIILVLKF